MSFAPTAPVSTACVAVDRWEHPCSDVEAEPAERAPDAIWCKFVQSAADADRASDTNARPITTAVPTDSKPWWFKAITTFFRPMTGQSSPQPLPLNLLPSTSCPQPFALNLLPSTSRVEFSESAGVRHCRLENSHKRAPFARLLLRVTNSCVSKLEVLTFCTANLDRKCGLTILPFFTWKSQNALRGVWSTPRSEWCLDDGREAV